ncbi:DUF927 domain-containing protein [Comamonas sp. GB3 AK4-5]|uniref:DUF927 domain-containing protein n=1 Tax=Comamonas sp. GB3 AK4-5 TaxID=3231487 RepID=UPI00351E3A77
MKRKKAHSSPTLHTAATAQNPQQDIPSPVKQDKRAKEPLNLDEEHAPSPLPKAIKAVFRVVDEFGKRTGHLAVESVNEAAETVLSPIDLKKMSNGNLEEVTALAVDADLSPFQSRKGGNELAALIRQPHHHRPAYIADRDGYHRVDYGGKVIEFFVWRDKIHMFGEESPPIALLVSKEVAAYPPASGTQNDWMSEVGVHVVRNPYMLIAVLAGLAALLSQAFALPKLVLMFVGPSSQGKTTLLRVGQSLISSGKTIETFAGTTKGIELKLREHSDAPAFMDELRQADVPSDLIKLVFDIENGANRKVSSGAQKVVQRGAIRAALVAANESTVAEITSGVRVKVNEGIAARLLEVHIQAPHGTFHVLPDNMTAKQFAEHMKLATSRVYGAVWDAWVHSVATNASNIRSWLGKNLAQFEEELLEGLPVNNPVTARLVQGMAAWCCAGMLARRFGLLDIDRKAIISAVRLVLEEHLKRNIHGSHSVAEQVVATVRACIDQNASKFPPLAQFHSPEHSRIYGYRVGHGEDAEFLFLPSVFEQLVGQKYGTEAAARALSTAGFLKCTKGAGYQYQKRVPSMSGESERKRFYAVFGRIRFV